MTKKTNKLQKEHGGASHGAAGLGLGTVSQEPHEKVLEEYDEQDQKRKKKDVDALQKFEDYMAEATSTSDWVTRLANTITKQGDRHDTGVLNREGEIPGAPEVHDDLEWDKKKNPDHKTTMAMVSNTSNTYHGSSGLEKDFGVSQGDELSTEGDRDMIDGWDEKRRKRTNNAGGPLPDTSSMKMAKALPHYNNPGVVTGDDIDKKQKQGYTEKDPDNEFLAAFEKLMKEARSYHPTIDEEAKRVDEMDLGGAKQPPEQNSERAILGQ